MKIGECVDMTIELKGNRDFKSVLVGPPFNFLPLRTKSLNLAKLNHNFASPLARFRDPILCHFVPFYPCDSEEIRRVFHTLPLPGGTA